MIEDGWVFRFRTFAHNYFDSGNKMTLKGNGVSEVSDLIRYIGGFIAEL